MTGLLYQQNLSFTKPKWMDKNYVFAFCKLLKLVFNMKIIFSLWLSSILNYGQINFTSKMFSLKELAFFCSWSLFNFQMNDPLFLDKPHPSDHHVSRCVGDSRQERPVPVRFRDWGITLAHAIGTVPEQPPPPAVNLVDI